MNISLTPELETLISRRVASGRYSSASEVVREALRLLEQQEKLYETRLEQLRRDIDIGLTDLDRGRRRPFGLRTVERVKAQGRARLEALRKKRA